MSMSKMVEIATRYANGEEEDRLRSGKGKATDGDANSTRKEKQKVERKPSTEADAPEAGKFKGKMPGPKGVITVTSNRQRAEECLKQGSRIADQQLAMLELDEYRKTGDPAELMRSKKLAS
ncbi:hypothetical protein ZWY2020_028647 [Hordeum vulgare]|nr:hypothetical protein ZWY2020_028647 [Hordeum vulgare]